ncbi:T6SS phospholipase effector Tle1-like catalytic domain-containing protein [Montanilutibacter psychrotolerans]|uniref:DUF2235 domain-containing protein n=1 Tax=Montanilutibacter psychrotolerans TaxID=1327343 RepID=A0A3M8SQF7_9GAMM|nr:DUF2235 domain-containing protein [Lysobacter psychrotolerans]RNF83568.1 DUF2235 domain-containing protein [Lysobacter psychrotolerans]
MRIRSAPECSSQPTNLSIQGRSDALCNALVGATAQCEIDLHWGFFFDGTNNNLKRDAPDFTHSNVARLHEVFSETRDETRLRRYIAGVGTEFNKQIGDRGQGAQQKAGLAAGWGGEARLCWALLKFLDNLSRFLCQRELGEILGQPDPTTVRTMATDIGLPRYQLEQMATDEAQAIRMLRSVGMAASVAATYDTANADPNHAGRRRVLAERRMLLEKQMEQRHAARIKPEIGRIRLSVFGFSRGATEARVFCNWLREACDPAPGGGLNLCGIPIEFDFLGIFDTVASVGVAKITTVFDGHGNYAQEADLRIPDYVKRCLHLVAAHEVRASFPLDTAWDSNCEEVVYPGVHSDVGGGYRPGEQGKGYVDGKASDAAKLSQIPLAHMYREAVKAGVPLDLDAATDKATAAFNIAPQLIAAFNGYVRASQSVRGASTRELVQGHYGLFLRWRRLRMQDGAELFANQPFVARAKAFKQQDYEDLVRANRELISEWQFLVTLERVGLAVAAQNVLVQTILKLHAYRTAATWVLQQRLRRWLEVKPYWNETQPLDSRIVRLFDDYVHDSRAWFKVLGAASEAAWIQEQGERMVELERRDAAWQSWKQQALRSPGFAARSPPPPSISAEDKQALQAYRRSGGRDLPEERSGREPYELFGFLRWRTSFPGGESFRARERLQDEARRAHEAAVQAHEAAAKAAIRNIRFGPNGVPLIL